MNEPGADVSRDARPEDLSSLRRLERKLHQAGWRVKGKSPREWLAELVLLPPYDYDLPYAPDMLAEAGLAAVPAIVDALRTRRLDPRHKRDLQIRGQCMDVLVRIEPPPTCAVPALLETLHIPSATLRRQALWTLAKLKPRSTPLAVRELLARLERKNDPLVRAQAARTLSRLEGPLPSEVRLAALAHLVDPEARVRRYTLQILERLPAPDPEVRTALEEQVILDDANRSGALRALMRFDAPRALALLEEELQLPPTPRNERSGQALQLIAGLGARAAPLLPALNRFDLPELSEEPRETAVDAIIREQLFLEAPPPDTSRLEDVRARLLLTPPPPPGPDELPARALARWAEGFLPLGLELCARVALAAARRAVERWDAHYFQYTSAREGLFALEDWVCAPSEEAARRATELGYIVPSQLSAPDAFSAAWTITFAAWVLLSDEQRQRWETHHPPITGGGYLGTAVYTACRCLQGASVVAFAIPIGESGETEPLSAAHAVEEVRRAIVAEVLPWVLGTWDPVRDVHRRRRELLARPAGPQ